MIVVIKFLQRVLFLQPSSALRAVLLCLAIVLYGATGFLYFEQGARPELGWDDAFWYAIVTLTTVGYGDFFPTTLGGRFVVAGPMMFFGIGLLGYVLSLAAAALVQARTKELRGMATFDLENHLVIFNFPGLAKVERVLDELHRDPTFGQPSVVLIDEDLDELPPELAERGLRFVRGNPTRDETLTRASVARASHALVLSRRPGDPHSDDSNLAITLAIEGHASRVKTVVECVDFTAQELLRKAGCDRIVCTSRFDAHFLTHELLSPGVQEVVEEMTTNVAGEQIRITRYEGKAPTTFGRLAVTAQKLSHLAIGIRRAGEVHLNLAPDFAVDAGDDVITIGPARLAPGSLA